MLTFFNYCCSPHSENIFNGPDIAKQLPTEDRLFKQVDGWYFEFMLNVARLPNCMECGTRHGIRDKMVEHVHTLGELDVFSVLHVESKCMLRDAVDSCVCSCMHMFHHFVT